MTETETRAWNQFNLCLVKHAQVGKHGHRKAVFVATLEVFGCFREFALVSVNVAEKNVLLEIPLLLKLLEG